MTPLIEAQIQPPVAKKQPKVLEMNGDKRVDDYFWMREKTNPDVISHLEAENAYTASVMKDTEALQEKLYKEIVGRIKETDMSAPLKRGGYVYYTRTEQGKQYPTWVRKQGAKADGAAPEEILLDGNALAEGKKYFQLGGFHPSLDQKLLAYATDTEGNELLTIRVKDLTTGKLLDDEIKGAAYGFAWTPDGKTFFYTVRDPQTTRSHKVFRHTLGTPQAKDVLVFEEPDERFEVDLSLSRSKEYILIGIDSQTTSEVRYLRATDPKGEWKVLLPRQQDVEYDVAQSGDKFYIRISDTGKTFRLVEAPVSDPSKKNWKELIPARKDITLEDVDAFKNYLVLTDRDQGLRKVTVRNLSTGKEHQIDFPEPVYTVSPGGSYEFDSPEMRFTYTSMVTPGSVFDYNMETRERTLVKQQPVLGGYDPKNYTSERLFATATDGTKIPVSIVYKKGFKRDGAAPLLLYGYGSYGIPSEPGFSSERLSLLDRGFAFAIAHIRGGSDLGKPWHEAGRMLNKRNTFTDFIAAGEMLVKEKYTSPSRLAIMGGSAGGLLMGAVTNMRPDLFGAVIAKVPFVDVINTMSDATLPLTVGEYEEWGNPSDPKYYSYIRSYSPYDNVERQKFPNMLVTGGLNDPRVSYWEPTKWVAKLRENKKGDSILILKTNMGAGHFGASGRYDRYKETALDYSFLLKALGQPLQ